jgi:hypothetical protein
VLVLVPAACGGSATGTGPLPGTITRQEAGQTIHSGLCGSWLSPGIDAAFCAAGVETPAPSGSGIGQIEFTGAPRVAAEGGIAQAAGALAEGRSIGIKVDASVAGTLVAQAICDRTLVRATFTEVRFHVGDDARLSAVQVGETPVILLVRNTHRIAPQQELLVELTWMSEDAPAGCAFRVS